ncbi:MAG: DUF3892 domain-containing protein [Bacteroidota bacterium]
MIDTSRITSGFDLEFQLASGWFLTALRGLNDRGLLIPPGSIPIIDPNATITVDSAAIVFDQDDWDLEVNITIGILPIQLLASVALNDDGDELVLNTNLPNIQTTVPFDVLDGLAATPNIVKLEGDDDHENVMALLANLDLRASSQNGDPLPNNEHVERGDANNAQSFVPTDKHIALGVASSTLPRFANDIWHGQLRANDGSHPFPDSEDNQGNWQSVSMSVQNGRIRATLRAVANVDTPIIDIIPDPDITITVDLIPSIENGRLVFEIDVDTNIDFGILGNLLAALVGGIIGFVIGLFTGNPIGGAITGAMAGVVLLEVGEFIAGKVIAKKIQAQIDGSPLTQFYSCHEDVIHLATMEDQGQGLNLGFLDTIPSSIPIFFDNPDLIHERIVLISNQFDEISINGGGFAVEGLSVIEERFVPELAKIVDKVENGDTLTHLKYRRGNQELELSIDEIIERADQDEVPEPLRIWGDPQGDIEHLKEGKLPVACLHPEAIRREDTIITDIRFNTGLELKTSDTIMLQRAGVLVLPNLQLIDPVNGNPYYRAKADDSLENNFESLPEF